MGIKTLKYKYKDHRGPPNAQNRAQTPHLILLVFMRVHNNVFHVGRSI